MDKITFPASITLERGFANQKYKWKFKNKISNYRRPCKRAVIRFTCKNMAIKINNLKKEERQISVAFKDNLNVLIKRIRNKGISMQGYSGNHPYIQIIVNSSLPKQLWAKLEDSENNSITFPVSLELNLNEWKDIEIVPSDFILEVETEAKFLMNSALKRGFVISNISKGREYDLELINPNNKKFIIALSSHTAKNKSRSKEKTIQKILMDIAKMLPYLDSNNGDLPVIITRPIEFENSWSFTTKKYLDFYREKYRFIYLTTEFKNGWEDDIITELLKY